MILNRREALLKTSCGFGFLGLASILAKQSYGSSSHFDAKAKRVIFIYLNGGPSHVDTFDYKPLLDSKNETQDPVDKNRTLLKSQAKFSASGESGLMVSDFFPELQKHADDLCLINGMYTDSGNHEQARSFLHTGNFQFVRPSMGSWLVYGLGTENEELPGFITINATIGPNDYGSAFLPATFQGTAINGENIKNAIPNLTNNILSLEEQRKNLDLLQKINNLKLYHDDINSNLDALIKSYELAFKMQSSVPSVMDISDEPINILSRYGIGEKETDNFGKQCLMARKFAEAGVRFIEIGIGTWDFHQDIQKNMTTKCQAIDKPISALLSDLKESGMLQETLVICGGEFGRTPGIQKNATGRDHNHQGYSILMAGGGVKGGIRYGSTDDFGHKAVENKMGVHDLHATILHLMGLDHKRLTYRYSGRDFRLTDVYGDIHYNILG
jgi:hypothetical protein